jgi:hypothetical protein
MRVRIANAQVDSVVKVPEKQAHQNMCFYGEQKKTNNWTAPV